MSDQLSGTGLRRFKSSPLRSGASSGDADDVDGEGHEGGALRRGVSFRERGAGAQKQLSPAGAKILRRKPTPFSGMFAADIQKSGMADLLAAAEEGRRERERRAKEKEKEGKGGERVEPEETEGVQGEAVPNSECVLHECSEPLDKETTGTGAENGELDCVAEGLHGVAAKSGELKSAASRLSESLMRMGFDKEEEASPSANARPSSVKFATDMRRE